MRNRWHDFIPVLDYLGVLLCVFGLLLLAPLVVLLSGVCGGKSEIPASAFAVPALLAVALGLFLKHDFRFRPLDNRRAMILCTLGWVSVSALGAAPFMLGLGLTPLDAFFEAVAGFTTTGMTLLAGLDSLPASILFWRAFMQWLGGLGILTFFLTLIFAGGAAHRLYSAESSKVLSPRVTPSLFRTLRILWTLYILFTALIAGLLFLEGVSPFDAALHALSALATGGVSPHDASVGWFQLTGHPRFVLIEYTLMLGMLLGGVSFVVHYRVFTGRISALWDSLEVRLFWTILLTGTLVVVAAHVRVWGWGGFHETFRASLFQVTAMLTGAGFTTRPIGSEFFPPLARLVFLGLMLTGGCVGSTSGGIKVLRVGILGKILGRQVHRLVHGPSASLPVVVDGHVVSQEEQSRVGALLFAWLALMGMGAGVTAFLSEHDALTCASGMFSALNNVGPSFIPGDQVRLLHPGIKITYIVSMLAGRLEILPVLLLFSRRTWK